MKVCLICNKEFQEKNKRSVVCGEECQRKKRAIEQKERRIKENKIILQYKTCIICNKEFETYDSKKLTCSKECSIKSNNKLNLKYYHRDKIKINQKRKEKYYNKKTGEKLQIINTYKCLNCGNEFYYERKKLYCEECTKIKKREYNTNYVRNKRNKAKELQ